MGDKPIAAGKSSFDIADKDTLFAELGLEEGPAVLDVASGSGNYSLAIAGAMPADGRVYAVDLWEEGIQELRRRAAEMGLLNVDAAVADVSRGIPLADASVDVCLMATALHDLVEEHAGEGALNEIARVIRPQGRLVILEFKKIDGPPGPPLGVRLSPEQLDEIVTPAGFEKIRSMEAGPYLYLTRYERRK